jgi:hypothetical protein
MRRHVVWQKDITYQGNPLPSYVSRILFHPEYEGLSLHHFYMGEPVTAWTKPLFLDTASVTPHMPHATED